MLERKVVVFFPLSKVSKDNSEKKIAGWIVMLSLPPSLDKYSMRHDVD